MILIIGIPNAGKTTYSNQFKNVIHFDDIPHTTDEEWYNRCDLIVKEANDDVVVEGIYNRAKRRKKLLEICKDKPIKKCIWIDTDVNECIKRENRDRSINIVKGHYALFQSPTYDEGWDEIYIIRNGKKEFLSKR